MVLQSTREADTASRAVFPMPLFSKESFTRNLLPARPFWASSIQPVSLSLLLDRPRVVSLTLFLIIADIYFAPSGPILFANR